LLLMVVLLSPLFFLATELKTRQKDA